MAILWKSRKDPEAQQPRVLDVSASMQGSLVFQEPVVLRISGRFQGTLETRGDLTIGEGAQVQADITGESITIAGRVVGKVVAKHSLRLIPPAWLKAEIWTPVFQVEAGARLNGTIHMVEEAPPSAGHSGIKAVEEPARMTPKEVAEYLEMEIRLVEQWAQEGKIPALQEAGQWRFEKAKIDEWVAAQKSS